MSGWAAGTRPHFRAQPPPLRQVHALQAADKLARDLRAHAKVHGEWGSLMPVAKERTTAVAMAKQELENQIAEKQHERKALKRAERARVRKLDAANERHAALLDAQESSALQQQQLELRLAWAKQEAELRAQRRSEAARSDAQRRVQEGLASLTGDPHMK